MERQTNFTACILLILFLLVTAIVPVSAVSLEFVDSSYLEQNDYIITDNSGTPVTNITGDSTVSLTMGKAYIINFKPRGLFDFSEQTPGNLTYPNEIIEFLQENLTAIICLFGIMFIVAKWRGHS